ncbi:MAG: hypothetical protein R3C56_07185 [Pirellulaceae bacterium]
MTNTEPLPLFPDEPPSRWITVAQVGEIPEGEGRNYPLDKCMVAVFLLEEILCHR